MQSIKKLALVTPLLMYAAMQTAMAAHPLITDDAGTQGTGNHQLEVNGDRATERDDSSQTVGSVAYTYGLTPTLDLFAEQPFTVSAPRGINDTSLGLKWRFFEKDNTSIALKSSLSMANANEDKDFGSGRSNLSATLIVSHESGPWGLHYNVGLETNRFKSDDEQGANRRMLWKTSAAATYALTPEVKAVADIGIGRNSDIVGEQNPAYALTGVIYSPHKNLDLDAGMKFGLNNAEAKRQFGAGVTVRF
jgi:hypothetical protein